jgi:hypothetical protein
VTCSEYEHQAAHLTNLALQPAWKAYIWQRLNDLDQAPLFEGIKADVLLRIELLKQQQSSGG